MLYMEIIVFSKYKGKRKKRNKKMFIAIVLLNNLLPLVSYFRDHL